MNIQDVTSAKDTIDAKEAAHKEAVEALRASHAKDLDAAYDRAVTAGHVAHATELKQLQNSHNQAIALYKQELATAHENYENVMAEVKKQTVYSHSLAPVGFDYMLI